MQETRAIGELTVRRLTPADLAAVIAVDAKHTGRRRDEYFQVKLRESVADTGIQLSLAAEIDGLFCGFLLAKLYYGEFGMTEPTALLDTIAVHPDFGHRGAGSAMLLQLRRNLRAVGVARLQTEVDWDSPELLRFFHAEGFRPAPRLCLDLDLERPPRDADESA